MELIIQKIAEKISSSYEKELKNLISEKRDISEFILATKKTLDEIGINLVAEALATIDEAYSNSRARKQNWTVKSKVFISKEYIEYVKNNYERGNISYENMKSSFEFIGLTPDYFGYEYPQEEGY